MGNVPWKFSRNVSYVFIPFMIRPMFPDYCQLTHYYFLSTTIRRKVTFSWKILYYFCTVATFFVIFFVKCTLVASMTYSLLKFKDLFMFLKEYQFIKVVEIGMLLVDENDLEV